MTRRTPLLACVLVTIAIAGCGGDAPESPPPGSAGAGPSPSASAAVEPSSTPQPDPADPALVFPARTPCTAPCARTGVRYAGVRSSLNRRAGRQRLTLDLLRSRATPTHGALVVVMLHGGGFVSGVPSEVRPLAETLAGRGFLVASIRYRLADPARNDGAGLVADADLERASGEAEADAERAIAWIRRHAATLGASADPARYAVGGYSAGAIAALRVAVRGGDRATPAARRVRVGGAFAISGSECAGPFVARLGCRPAFDRADAPILLFHGDADEVIPLAGARETCAKAITDGGGCRAFFYPGQGHLWSNGTILGGADDLTARHPAVAPAIAAWLTQRLTP